MLHMLLVSSANMRVVVCVTYDIHWAGAYPAMNNIHQPIHLLWYNIYWNDGLIPYRPYHIYHGWLVFIPWPICYICYLVSSANVPVSVCVIYDIHWTGAFFVVNNTCQLIHLLLGHLPMPLSWKDNGWPHMLSKNFHKHPLKSFVIFFSSRLHEPILK